MKWGWLRRKQEELDPVIRRREDLEVLLKDAIGEADGLSWPGGRFTWKRARDRSETNWEELSRDLLVGFAPDEIKGKISEFTHPVAGQRRIYFSANGEVR